MTNEYNENVVERDIDDEVSLRKELIEKAKEIQDTGNWGAVTKEISNLQKKWKRIPYFESALEDELAEEFDGIIDTLYQNRKAGFETNKAKKHELILEVKKLDHPKDFNAATKKLNELMDAWKAVGNVGNKEEDDALWNEFNAARQAFFDNKHKHWEKVQEKLANAKAAKEALVEEAKSLMDSNDWTKTNNKMNELMESWKAIGFAGKDCDNALWDQFNEARKVFFDRRQNHYKELRDQQAKNLEAKKEIVARAKAIVEEKTFNKETTAKVTALTAEWKTIGSAGNEENNIWEEFRNVNDEYFNGLREYNEQRQIEWRNRLQETRARKQDLLNNQKRQLKRMQDGLVGLISQREVDEQNERIEDKKDFIAELEEDLKEIDAKLAK